MMKRLVKFKSLIHDLSPQSIILCLYEHLQYWVIRWVHQSSLATCQAPRTHDEVRRRPRRIRYRLPVPGPIIAPIVVQGKSLDPVVHRAQRGKRTGRTLNSGEREYRERGEGRERREIKDLRMERDEASVNMIV